MISEPCWRIAWRLPSSEAQTSWAVQMRRCPKEWGPCSSHRSFGDRSWQWNSGRPIPWWSWRRSLPHASWGTDACICCTSAWRTSDRPCPSPTCRPAWTTSSPTGPSNSKIKLYFLTANTFHCYYFILRAFLHVPRGVGRKRVLGLDWGCVWRKYGKSQNLESSHHDSVAELENFIILTG